MILLYRAVQKKGTVLLSTSLAWPAVAGCSRAETLSQLSTISFAQPCTLYPPLKIRLAILTVEPLRGHTHPPSHFLYALQTAFGDALLSLDGADE